MSVGRLVIISDGSWYKIELLEIVKTIMVRHSVIFNAVPWNNFYSLNHGSFPPVYMNLKFYRVELFSTTFYSYIYLGQHFLCY